MTNEQLFLHLDAHFKRLEDYDFAKIYAEAMGLVTPEIHEKQMRQKEQLTLSRVEQEKQLLELKLRGFTAGKILEQPKPYWINDKGERILINTHELSLDLEVDPPFHSTTFQTQEENQQPFIEKAFEKTKVQDGKVIFSQIPF